MLQLRNLFFLIIFQILIGFTALYAQGITDGPVTLEAESLQYEENTGLIHATGNILLSFLGYSVNAQEFQFSPDNQMLFLKDKIAIQKKDQLLSSDSIKYNLDKNQAVATNIKLTLKNMHINGQKMIITPEKIEILNADFTTCPQPQPHYLIKSREIQFYPKWGVFVAFDGILYFYQVPVMYLPSYIYGSRQYAFGQESFSSPLPLIGKDEEQGWYIKENLGYFFDIHSSGTLDLGYIQRDGYYAGFNHYFSFNNQQDLNLKLYYVEKYVGAARISYNWRLPRQKKEKESVNLIDEFLFNFYNRDLPLSSFNFIVSYNDLNNNYRVSYLPLLSFEINKMTLPLNFNLTTDMNIGNIKENATSLQFVRGNLNSRIAKEYQLHSIKIEPSLSYYGYWYKDMSKWERILGKINLSWELPLLNPGFSYTKIFFKDGASPFIFDTKDAIENNEIGFSLLSQPFSHELSIDTHYNLDNKSYRDINFKVKINSDCYKVILNYEFIEKEFRFGVEI